ncbi:hypothetical protein GCM10027580_18300 [Corynebacterium faecale]
MQTTFLSVGFAGLAIAAQLFAETPLAVGASRRQILERIRASQFVGVGLVANTVIAVEALWLSSAWGLLISSFPWLILTIVLLVRSSVNLVQLFGRPSEVDEVVREALKKAFSERLERESDRYTNQRRQLKKIVILDQPPVGFNSPPAALEVPVPQAGLVIKAINPKTVERVLDKIKPRTTENAFTFFTGPDPNAPVQIRLHVEPGDRTRSRQTAFSVYTPHPLSEGTQGEITELLQSSIEFEPSGSVTPEEETNREIAHLKDAIAVSLRSGAFATAERSLKLLGDILRDLWSIDSKEKAASAHISPVHRKSLFRSIGEVERDALLSPRAADIFVGQAVTRVLEASQTKSAEYLDECLRSFTRIWSEVLQDGRAEFDPILDHILFNVRELAAFSTRNQQGNLSNRATWVLVELVKLSLDSHKLEAAEQAVQKLNHLSDFFDRGGTGRLHVIAGQLILAGWVEYLTDKGDDRAPAEDSLRVLVTPGSDWSELIAARHLIGRGEIPFSSWEWWELNTSGLFNVQSRELSNYIDVAYLDALCSSAGVLPAANDQETASEYKRLLEQLEKRGEERGTSASVLKQELAKEIAKWEALENARLAKEPLSDTQTEALRAALKETFNTQQRLASLIPVTCRVPDDVDTTGPFGRQYCVSRQYLVDNIFNQTPPNPAYLGQWIAHEHLAFEEHKIIETLRSLQARVMEPSVQTIQNEIYVLADESEHYVLLTPPGGLPDQDAWYSPAFHEALEGVTHIQCSSLKGEAFLFDRRTTLMSCRKPEEKEDLDPVGETSIALGVFDDVEGGDKPQVRLETGEYFIVWPGATPRVIHFGDET